jgi:rod shape-determining protein MreB
MALTATGLTQQPALRVKSFIDDAIGRLLESCSRYQLDSDSELARQLEGLKKRAASNEIVLTVLGEFSAGKTTFINRLLGTDILQTGLLPTTSVCTYIRYGKSAACEVSLKSGKVLSLSPEQVPQYSTDGEHTSQVTSVRVSLPASLLADGLVVVDTPGVNVNIAAHEAITERAISEANACLFLMDARQPGKKTTTDFLRSINSRIDKFFFVLNRADILDPGEQQEALQYLSNVLTQECGIPNPRVLLLSSAFKEDNLEWGQRFTSFEHDLRNFMEAERDLVICAELARSLDEAIARAERLLVSQHRLAEDELAIRYKTRLPDSERLIENLARTLGAIVAETKRHLLDGYPAFHQDKCAELHSRLTNCIEAADSKESLVQQVPPQLRVEFGASAEALNAYFRNPLDACFRNCQDMMVSKVQDLFRGIRFVEEKRFLRRTTTWFAIALGGGAVAWATTTALSLEFGTAIGCVAAFAWLWFEWLYFKHINESRFGAPTLLSLPEALVRYGDMTSGAQLQKYVSLQQLSALEANLPEYGATAARGSLQVARVGMSVGHPVFAIATLGVGLAIAGLTEGVSRLVGAWRKLKDWLFGPSLQELKDEMLAKALEIHAEFERNSGSAGAEAIALTADAVCMALATNLKEVVQRYRYTLDKLLQSQSSLLEHLERKRRELTSELAGLTTLRGKTAESLQMLRVAMGNEVALFPLLATEIPSLEPSALAKKTLNESLETASQLDLTTAPLGTARAGTILDPSFSSEALGIDLGTTNTRVYAGGKGTVVNEPSIVAINKNTGEVEAVGKEARKMLGGTPGNIVAIKPIKDGVIADAKIAEKMLNYVIQKAHNGKTLLRPRIVIAVPSEITRVEKRAVMDSAYRAKASEVHLVEQVMVAAIGAGLPITELNMIVDFGGGTTDIAVIALNGIVYSRSVRIAGNQMDEAIMNYLKRKYNLLIGEGTAEQIKIEIGSAYPLDKQLTMEIKGRDLIKDVLKTITVDDSEIREALSECVSFIMSSIRVALGRLPPELSADISGRGIVLTGGGALLKNLDKRIRDEIGLPVLISDDPVNVVSRGLGLLLQRPEMIQQFDFSADLPPGSDSYVPDARLPIEQVDEPLHNMRRWQIGPHVWVATALLVFVAALTWLPTFFPTLSRQADGHGSPQASLPPKFDSTQTALLPTPPAETAKPSMTDAIVAPWLKSITEVLQRPYTPLPEVPIPEQLWRDVGITPTNEERKGNANSLRLSDGQLPELLVEDTNPDFCGSGSGCPWSIYGLRSEVTRDGRVSLKYKSLLESQGGVYVLDSVTNSYRDLLIDGGYGGDVLKFDGTLYKVTECFSHDYKKLDDIHPSDCRSVGSSTAQPARDDVQLSNPVLAPAPSDSNSTPSTTPMASTNLVEPTPKPAAGVLGERGSSSAGTWTDPATGLMWAGPMWGGRDSGNNVNWYEAKNYCASLGLGTYSNWRLPSVEEMEGVTHGVAGGGYEVNGSSVPASDDWWWSATQDSAGAAWGVGFTRGAPLGQATKPVTLLSFPLGQRGAHLRAFCVRRSSGSSAEPSPKPATSVPRENHSYSAGTWTDPATGLMWAARDNGADVNWNGATSYCAYLSLAGYSHWRLPSIGELEGIYDPRNTARMILAGGRPYDYHIKGGIILTGWHWSATQDASSGKAWTFLFNNGVRFPFRLNGDSSSGRALCVRGFRE